MVPVVTEQHHLMKTRVPIWPFIFNGCMWSVHQVPVYECDVLGKGWTFCRSTSNKSNVTPTRWSWVEMVCGGCQNSILWWTQRTFMTHLKIFFDSCMWSLYHQHRVTIVSTVCTWSGKESYSLVYRSASEMMRTRWVKIVCSGETVSFDENKSPQEFMTI